MESDGLSRRINRFLGKPPREMWDYPLHTHTLTWTLCFGSHKWCYSLSLYDWRLRGLRTKEPPSQKWQICLDTSFMGYYFDINYMLVYIGKGQQTTAIFGFLVLFFSKPNPKTKRMTLITTQLCSLTAGVKSRGKRPASQLLFIHLPLIMRQLRWVENIKAEKQKELYLNFRPVIIS